MKTVKNYVKYFLDIDVPIYLLKFELLRVPDLIKKSKFSYYDANKCLKEANCHGT